MKLDTEVIAPGRDRWGEDAYRYVLNPRKATNPIACFAARLITEACKTAFDADGEDSSGRQKGRRLAPKEVVDYCTDMAAVAYEEFERRGWLIDVPSAEELRDRNREADKAN